MKAKELTKDEFLKNVANYENGTDTWQFEGSKPCIVDFFATWCGPCKSVAPVLDEIAEEYDGQIDIYKVDVDKEEELAAVFGIQSIPTFLFCPTQANPQMAQGAMDKATFKKIIEEVLMTGMDQETEEGKTSSRSHKTRKNDETEKTHKTTKTAKSEKTTAEKTKSDKKVKAAKTEKTGETEKEKTQKTTPKSRKKAVAESK